MGYKENRKREMERWGSQSNNRQYGKSILDEFASLPPLKELEQLKYLQSMADNRAFKITQELLNEAKTRWLINPQPQKFNVLGMVYHADQIKAKEKTRYMYINTEAAITIACINPKRGVWKVYLKPAQ